MGSRTKARKRALDILFAADVRDTDVSSVLADASAKTDSDPQATLGYARAIVEGVVQHRVEVDELIESYSQGWSLERMPHVDRAIVRIAIWEMLFNPDVPVAVAIDEAVELAKSMSTEDSARFVNGLLGAVAATHAHA